MNFQIGWENLDPQTQAYVALSVSKDSDSEKAKTATLIQAGLIDSGELEIFHVTEQVCRMHAHRILLQIDMRDIRPDEDVVARVNRKVCEVLHKSLTQGVSETTQAEIKKTQEEVDYQVLLNRGQQFYYRREYDLAIDALSRASASADLGVALPANQLLYQIFTQRGEQVAARFVLTEIVVRELFG